MKPRVADAVIVALVAATRMPLLSTGFGRDMDAWRIACSGAWLARTGEYIISRRPGYPLAELPMAGLAALEHAVHGPGWIVPNLFTTLVFGVQCLVLVRLARRWCAPHPLLITCAYLLHPLVLDHSLGALDFHLSMLLGMLAILAAMDGRRWRAAVLFGLALAGRATLATWGVAFIPILLGRSGPAATHHAALRRNVARSIASWYAVAALIAAPFYILVLLQLHSSIVPLAQPVSSYWRGWAWIGVFKTLGLDAALVLLLGIVQSRQRIARLLAGRDPRDAIVISALVPTLVFFLVRPHDNAYLLPVLPLMLALVDRLLRPGWVAAFSAAMVINGVAFVPGVETRSMHGRERFVAWSPGELFDILYWRRATCDESLFDPASLPRHSALVLGGLVPACWFHLREAVFDGRLQVVDEPILNFNNPLYDATDDRYFEPGWYPQRTAMLTARGYVLVRLQLPPRPAAR